VRILLTGAGGFVGRQTLNALVQTGHDIVVASSQPAFDGRVCDWIVGNLMAAGEPERIAKAARADRILHLAWTSTGGSFWGDPQNLDWVAATLCLVRATIRHGASRVAVAGTCHEYAWPQSGKCVENVTPLAAHTLYDGSKDATRRILQIYADREGVVFAWARLFYLFGHNEHKNKLVASIARALVAGQPARCSSGRVVRDYMDVRDAGAALASLATSETSGAINVASGNGTLVAEIARSLGKISGRPELIELGTVPDRPFEPQMIVADTRRLNNEVGFHPRYDLDSGLRDALEHWRVKLRA
jgi:nucleoside-diphosphate-sugar epimerase